MRRLAPLLLAGLLLPAAAAAAPAPGRWLLDHLVVDTAAVAFWRAGWVDPQRAGFLAVGGGGEVNLGVETAGGYAILGGARVLAGIAGGRDLAEGSLTYLEATGQLGAQIRLTDWVRLGAGATVGRLWRCCAAAADPAARVDYDALSLIAGGFLRFGVDWLPRTTATLLRALSLHLRIDLAGHPIDTTATLPTSTLTLAASLGFRL